MKMERSRKERLDKKRSIKPMVSVDLYDTITSISYICTLPLKTIGETLIIEALNSKQVLESISKFFRRSFTQGNVIYCGDPSREPFRIDYKNFDTRKIHMRFRQHTHENIAVLAYALDCSVSTAGTLVLEGATQTREVILSVISKHVSLQIDHRRRVQLRQLIRSINDMSNDDIRQTTLSTFLNFIIDECIEQAVTLKQKISEYLD